MQAVRHKKKRKDRKRGRMLVFVLLLFAVLACVSLLLSGKENESVHIPEKQEEICLLSRAEADVSAVAIAPENGESYPIRFEADGSASLLWQDKKLRASVTDAIRSSAAEMPAEAVITEKAGEEELAAFGLLPARVTVTVTYADGEKKQLLIGDEAHAEESQRYCMVSGDDRVYTVLTPNCEAFLHEMVYLYDFGQPELDSSLLDEIIVTGKIDLRLMWNPSGWQMKAPYEYPADRGKTEALLRYIDSMAFEAYLGEADETDLSLYGLDEPELTVTLRQTATVISGETADGKAFSMDYPEQLYTLLIGAETGKSGVYVIWKGQVFKASNFLLGFWKEIRAEEFLLKNPVNFLTNDLRKLELRADGRNETYSLELVESIGPDNEIATDEYGQILWEAEITRGENGEKADTAAFLNWYTRMSAVAPVGRCEEGKAQNGAETLAEITMTTQSLTRTVALTRYDALHLGLAVDGVTLYYVDNSVLDLWMSAP